MTTLLKPSTFIPTGIQVQQIDNLTLFKFTEELGDRLQELLDRKKADLLSAEESIELATIGELDEIFSYIKRSHAAIWCGYAPLFRRLYFQPSTDFICCN
jgi:hypothetical protein